MVKKLKKGVYINKILLQSVTNKSKTELTLIGKIVYFLASDSIRITFVSYIRREKNGYN